MTRRLRTTAAFVQAESDQQRWFRQATTGDAEVRRGRDVLLHRDPDGEYRARYWCAADRPPADGVTFAVKPVYRTTKVPEDARCEECGIAISELQEAMTSAFSHAEYAAPPRGTSP